MESQREKNTTLTSNRGYFFNILKRLNNLYKNKKVGSNNLIKDDFLIQQYDKNKELDVSNYNKIIIIKLNFML